MITELEELVFGLNSYEKTKVEDRFLMIEQKIPTIKISNIEEYTMLENCIFKIREQLRVKSSNLNSNIKKTNKLTKKKVNEILHRLEEIRFSILNRAFNSDLEVISKKNDIEQNEVEQQFIEDNEQNKHQEIIEPKKVGVVSKKEDNSISNDYSKNPKKILLNDNNSLSTIKDIFSLNESLQLSNSLITIHPNENSLAVLDNSDFNTSPLHLKKSIDSKELELIQDKLKSSEEYIDLNKSEPKIQTKKNEEDSLEELINSKESTHKNIFTPSKDEKIVDISIENENNPIIIERKEIIEKQKEEEKILPYIEEKKNEVINDKNMDNNNIIPDDILNISIDSYAKSIGQYKLQFKNTKDLIEQKDSDLMYSIVFSKVLLQSMFESIQPQGTMIVSSLNSDSIYLTPRYVNDEVFNFNRIQEEDSNLQSIQNKILQTMQDSLSNSDNNNNKTTISQSNTELKDNSNNNTESESDIKIENKEEKAKYLLSSLRRLA